MLFTLTQIPNAVLVALVAVWFFTMLLLIAWTYDWIEQERWKDAEHRRVRNARDWRTGA